MTGFVDLQVNGYAGVDFNADELSEQEVAATCQRLTRDGNDQVLATVITAPLDAMVTRIARIAKWIETNSDIASVIAGIHVEGPFISSLGGFVGAHPRSAVLPATEETAKKLIGAGNGQVRLVTLAPEVDPGARVTKWLSDTGHVVAGGHTDASLDDLRRGIDHGLVLFTHLGNGCPAQLPRHDNIVQRALSLSDQLTISFIADGHHVPDFALRNYLARVPDENIVIVTDAISAAGLGAGRYELAGQTVEVDKDGAAWAAGREHFAGCATTMPAMVKFLRAKVGATEEQIRRWTTTNPRRLLDRK